MADIVLLTRSGSEFLIHPDGSIERMGLVSTRFTEFVPAGSKIEVLTVGQPCMGYDPEGGRFTTNIVDRMAYMPDP